VLRTMLIKLTLTPSLQMVTISQLKRLPAVLLPDDCREEGVLKK